MNTFYCILVLANVLLISGTSSAQKLAVLSRQESVLPSAIVQSPQHSDSTGRKNTDTYGLSDDKFQRMRNGMNRLRRNAAGRLNQTLTDEYLNSLPLTLGDILLTSDQLQFMINKQDVSGSRRQKRKIVNFENFPTSQWSTSTSIKYVIDTSFTSQHQAMIDAAVAEWMKYTCVVFEKHTSSYSIPATEQYVYFTSSSSGCASYVGKISTSDFRPQPVYLNRDNCFLLWGQVIHEIGHVIGLWHEHVRPDRDNYVNIYLNNVNSADQDNFDKESTTYAMTLGVPYDYGSVMHYNFREFANQAYVYTILPKDTTQVYALGQRSELSFYDHKIVNLAYCNAKCPSKLYCKNGGYTDPKNCWACRCPDGWGGTLCDQVHQGSIGCTPLSKNINVQQSNNINQQFLQSPNFADPRLRLNTSYTPGSSCAWILQAPYNCVINFWIDYVGLLSLDTGTCVHWVEIQYKNSHVIRGRRFCGYGYPSDINQANPLVSDGSQIVVIFRSPEFMSSEEISSDSYQGFQMHYELGACSTTTSLAPTQTTTTSSVPTQTSATSSLWKLKSLDFTVLILAALLLTGKFIL